MKSKIATRSLLMLALTSMLVLQVTIPIRAQTIYTTDAQVRIYIYNPKAGKFTLIGYSGWITDLPFVEVSGKYTASVDVVANKMNLYNMVLRNYGESWASIDVSVQYPYLGEKNFPAPHGPKLLKIQVMVDDLGGHGTLYFDVTLDPPAS